jgi:hypothetical protein
MKNSFQQDAQHLTRITVEGTKVDPSEICTNCNQDSGITSKIEIRICKKTLVHELNEAEVSVDMETLKSYVIKDLNDYPVQALTGYIGIAQAILGVPKKTKFFWPFIGRKVNTKKLWSIVRIDLVDEDEKSLIFHGTAQLLE